jgi:hypothetical protein
MDGLDNRTDGHGMIDGQAVSFLFLRVFSLAFPWRRRPLNRLYYPHLWSFTLLCTCARLLLFRLLAPGRHTLVLVVAGRDTYINMMVLLLIREEWVEGVTWTFSMFRSCSSPSPGHRLITQLPT